MKILSIEIKHMQDDSPDLSHLGEYSDSPGPDSINRVESGEIPLGSTHCKEYRYFNPAMSGEETGNPDSPQQDYQRMISYNLLEWYMLGIGAKAQVEIAGVIQTITSSGLWGIESDSDDSYLESIEKEQLEELSEILETMGFVQEEIESAVSV